MRAFAASFGTGVLAALIAFGTAAAQMGSVLSYQKISDTAGNFTATIDNTDELGGAVANLGDLDGPGPSVGALAVGSSFDDDGGLDRGAVYILFLDGAGAVLSSQKISDTAGNFTAVIDNGDEFGSSVTSLGDLDGAGGSKGALAIGAIGDDDGGPGRGAVYLVFVDSAGVALSYQKISDTAGNFTAIIDNLDEFGSSVAALGDLDGAGPGVAALAVGTAFDDDGGADRGAVYVLFLDGVGNVLSHQKISSTVGGFPGPLDNFDEFGGTVSSLGDFDGPGPGAGGLAVGATADDDGGTDRGAVYVLVLTSTGSVLSSLKISDLAGNFTATIDNLDYFGTSAGSLGNLDGLGPSRAVLAVGTTGDDDGGTDRGAVYLLFLEGNPVTGVPGTPPRAEGIVLGQPRPNPFRHETTIPFRLREAASVRIDICDVQGRLVRRLVRENAGPGDHRAVWDGRDESGRRLASGSYFYRMWVNGRSATGSEKALLLK